MLSEGLIEIRTGRYPRAATDFYRPLEEWVSEYVSRHRRSDNRGSIVV
ncbi:MAG: hypothetical protein MZV63_40570 [Marinilabiliales bacterium]|nr:hypothetical protein [Marinilabiliales bacterium]